MKINKIINKCNSRRFKKHTLWVSNHINWKRTLNQINSGKKSHKAYRTGSHKARLTESHKHCWKSILWLILLNASLVAFNLNFCKCWFSKTQINGCKIWDPDPSFRHPDQPNQLISYFQIIYAIRHKMTFYVIWRIWHGNMTQTNFVDLGV